MKSSINADLVMKTMRLDEKEKERGRGSGKGENLRCG